MSIVLPVVFWAIFFLVVCFAEWLSRKTRTEQGAFVGYCGVIAAYLVAWHVGLEV